ncbi:MAG: protein kinase domain-containing protein, partial [Planctomycetota bacterium]
PADPDQPDRASASAGASADKSRESDSPDSGKTLGPYRILEEIGRGGMGVVYKAFHPQLKRTVALKVLIAGEDATEEAIKRFHREAEAVAKLGHHPNIVPVHDIGREGRQNYFAMHYVEGKPLDRMIDDGDVAPKKAASIAKRVANGLAHAHSHGVLHRDIKPANILVDEAGEPQITDFGLAKDVTSESKMTRSGVTLGTPQYMPPEQANGILDAIDERSDVYSLGATLYEMLTLRPPFEGSTVLEVIQKVVSADPVSPRRGNPSIPRDLETICLKCIEKDPARRYPGSADLAEDLGRFLEGSPIQARPVSVAERILRRVRRNRAAAIACAGILVALATGLIFGVRLLTAEKEKEASRVRAERAERILEKGRKVSSVFLAVNGELGGVLGELKAIHHGPGTLEERRKKAAPLWERVEAFGEELPRDSASQAAWIAVKGWYRRFAGYEEEAFEQFRESRERDPDVPHGLLFEAMIRLLEYFDNTDLPLMISGAEGLEFVPSVVESKASKEAQGRFMAVLDQAKNSSVWGESSTKAFRSVFENLEKIRNADFEAADRGLGKALGIPEMALMTEEILHSRALVRYYLMRFPEGRRAIDRVLDKLPEDAGAFRLKGKLFAGEGQAAMARGDAAASDFLKQAIENYSEAIRLGDKRIATNARGLAYLKLAELCVEGGADPTDVLERSLEDFGVSISQDPEWAALSYQSRSHVFYARGRYRRMIGEDGLDDFRLALKDAEEALRLRPEWARGLDNCGTCTRILGQAEKEKGESKRAHYQDALRLHGEALQRIPDSPQFLNNRAIVYMNLGELESHKGRDPTTFYELALADLDKALDPGGNYTIAWGSRGNVWSFVGQYRARVGGNAKEAFLKAIQDYSEALDRKPTLGVLGNRGNTLRMLGDVMTAEDQDPRETYRKAARDVERALALCPGYLEFRLTSGLVYRRLGEAEQERGIDGRPWYEKSMKEYGKMLAKKPTHAVARVGLGNVYLALGKIESAKGGDPRSFFEQALAEAEKGGRADPEYVLAMELMGEIHLQTGK